MKRLKITAVTLFLSLIAIHGQEQKDVLSGSFSCKAKYAAGKNNYLFDECKVDYTYRLVLSAPVYQASMTWKRRNDFSIKNDKISYSDLRDYPDLQKRFELITPTKVRFKFTVMFYSDKSGAYIASAKSEMVVPIAERAGATVDLPTPVTSTWEELFTDVVTGKQDAKAPGVVIPDESLEKFFHLERISNGKLDKTARTFTRSMRQLFRATNRLEVSNVEMEVTWDDSDYTYIIREYSRRKAKQTTNRLAISENDPDFWHTTIIPYEVWMNAIEEADDLFAQRRWEESKVYYQKAAEADHLFSYPVRKIEKIQKYFDYKSRRNVGGLELVFVPGKGDLKSFYIGKTEITQSQWRRVMGPGSNPSGFRGCSDCPVENVSWDDTQEFLRKLNEQTEMRYRLPKLKEWEHAARGGVKSLETQYSGSGNLDDIAWTVYNSEESTHPVAKKSPNELGIYDMTGNVSEWVADAFDKSTRIVKGGSWSDDATNSVISIREKYDSKHKNNRIGFRICQDE